MQSSDEKIVSRQVGTVKVPIGDGMEERQQWSKSKRDVQESLSRYEESHAIPLGTLTRLGWKVVLHDGRPAIEFQTANGPRWRFTDGEKPKYDQNVGYAPCWYGLQRAAQQAKSWNVLIDCNGAASTIAAQFHGVPAFSLQSGEETTPAESLLDDLASLWQDSIYVTFDCDPAGRRGAIKRVQLYRRFGWDAYALDLGLDKVGGDLADFCAEYPTDTLDQLLLSCKRLDIPDPEPPRPHKPYVAPDQSEADRIDLAQRAINVIPSGERDDYMGWVEVGMSLQELGNAGLSIWEAWSAGSDKFKPSDCAKKWKSFKKAGHTLGYLFYLADKTYGPTWRPYREPVKVNERFEVETPKQASPIENGSSTYPDSLPISVRGTMNAYADSRIAPVLELWLEAIHHGYMEPGEPQTVKCLVFASEQLKRGLSEHSIRQGLDQGVVLFFKKWLHYVLSSKNNTQYSEIGDLESDQTLDNPCRCVGRDPEWWVLNDWPTILSNAAKGAIAPILQAAFPPDSPTVAPIRAEFLDALGRPDADQLSQELDTRYHDVLAAQPGYEAALQAARDEYGRLLRFLANPQTAPIPRGWVYHNATEYAACCARALLESVGGESQFSRPKLCQRLGCTDRALPGILNRAGIQMVKEQFVELPVKSIQQLRAIHGWSCEARGWAKAVKSSLKDAPYSLGKKGVLNWAEGELAAGAALTVRYQQCNRQIVVTDTQPLHQRKTKTVPQFTYCQRLLLTALLSWLLALVAPTVEPQQDAIPGMEELNPAPVVVRDYQTGKDRYRVQLRLYWWLVWVLHVYGPRPAPETYAEQWIRRLATAATPVQIDRDRAVDHATGEIIDFTRAAVETTPVQLALEALTAPVESVPACSEVQAGAVPNNALEALSETWKSMVSQFDQLVSGAGLLLLPARTGLSPAGNFSSGSP